MNSQVCNVDELVAMFSNLKIADGVVIDPVDELAALFSNLKIAEVVVDPVDELVAMFSNLKIAEVVAVDPVNQTPVISEPTTTCKDQNETMVTLIVLFAAMDFVELKQDIADNISTDMMDIDDDDAMDWEATMINNTSFNILPMDIDPCH
jgi:hypothetical protein